MTRFSKILRFFPLLAACTLAPLACIDAPEAPVAPSTDLQMSIPLLNRVKRIYDFRTKDSAVTVFPDGRMTYESRRAFDPLRLDEIQFDPEPRIQSVEIGAFTVDPPAPLSVDFNFKALTGSDPPPNQFVVPPGTLPILGANFGPLSSFEFISLASGTVSLRIRNGFPFPVELVNPFTLRNNVTTTPIDTDAVASFSFAGTVLSENQDTTTTVSLSGILVRNLLRLLPSSITTPGSGGLVSITPQTGLSFEITFSNILVDSARAQIPAQSVYSFQDSLFTLDDSTAIRYASFRSGRVDLVLSNEIDVDVDVFARVKELYDRQTGQSYSLSRSFAGRGSVTVPIDLSLYEVRTTPAGLGTNMTFSVGVDAVQSLSQRTLRRTDLVRAELVPRTPVRAERLTGRIKPTSTRIETGASGATLGDFGSKFKGTAAFDSLDVSLILGSSQGFPVDYNLRLVAMNREQIPPVTDSIDVPPPIGSVLKRFIPAPNQTTTVNLGSTSILNNFFSKFFPFLPDTFIVRGSMVLNPPDLYLSSGEQTIDDTSRISATVAVAFPLDLSISGGELVDTLNLGDEENFPTDLIAKTQAGTMFFEVTNGLPLALTFRAAFLGNSPLGRDTLLWLPKNGAQILPAASIDPTRSAGTPSLTRFSVALTGSDLDKFNQADVLWYRLQVETAGGGGGTVKFKDSDFIQIKASANIVYRVNER